MSHHVEVSSPQLRKWLFGLFLLALAVRSAGMVGRGEHVPPGPPAVIGMEAGVVSDHLLAGRGFASPFMLGAGSPPGTHLPPLYPLLLAGLKCLNPSPTFVFYVAIFINLLASALVPVVAVEIARSARWPRAVGWWAGLAMCFCPEAVRAGGLVWDEALFTLAVAVTLWLMLRLAPASTPLRSSDEPRMGRKSLWLGVLAGAISLLNPAFLPATLVGWFVLHLPRWKQAWQQTGLVLLAALVIGLPWHLRNWVFLDPPAYVFVRGSYWLAVWTNLNPVQFQRDETGRLTPLPLHPWQNTDPQALALIPTRGEGAYFQACRDQVLARIRQSPVEYATHVLKQVEAFWLGTNEARYWRRSETLFFFAQGLPAMLGIIGLLLARRWERKMWGKGQRAEGQLAGRSLAFLAIILLVFPLPYYFAGGAARYRHPIDVILYLGLGWFVFYVQSVLFRSKPALPDPD